MGTSCSAQSLSTATQAAHGRTDGRFADAIPHISAAILPPMRLSMGQTFVNLEENNRAEALSALLGHTIVVIVQNTIVYYTMAPVPRLEKNL